MTDAPRLLVRTAARLVLLDPQDRVLLSLDEWDGRSWWCTPGGGVEPGETLEQAALRETYEETGFDDIELGPLLVRHHWTGVFLDLLFDQTESIFLARTAGGVPEPKHLEPLEEQFMQGFRWWQVDDLLGTTDIVYPIGLADMVASTLRHGPPAEPWSVG